MPRARPRRVAFLLNHAAPHQVPHVAPYAFRLSQIAPDVAVDILCSTQGEADFARDLSAGYPGQRARIETLTLPPALEWAAARLEGAFFARKTALLRWHARRLAGYAVVAAPEKTVLQIAAPLRRAGVRLVHTGHGGAGVFRALSPPDARLGRFDLLLAPSAAALAPLIASGAVRADRVTLTGAAKLEAMARLRRPRTRLFGDDRPVALYNPHHRGLASSWAAMGRDVVAHFQAQDAMNLIVAPHVLLFRRPMGRGARRPAWLRDGGPVRVDQGGRAAIDMTLADAADVYIGDASSQVFEFIARPRPCVFLNPARRAWRDDPAFALWRCGPVVETAAELGAALTQARDQMARYAPIQAAALARAYAHVDDAVSLRGAEAILALMDEGA